MGIEADYSELEGKKVECPEQCGMCCLCQPEILPSEMGFFRRNHADLIAKTRGQDAHFAIKMKKGVGSCSLLKNRRCTIYNDRPVYCRQFPYHIYVGDKISVELDLSCRGVWTGKGVDAVKEAEEIVSASSKRIEQAFRRSKEVYEEFNAICNDAGISCDVASIRKAVVDNVMKFMDPATLYSMFEIAADGEDLNLYSIKPKEGYDDAELQASAEEAGCDSMASSGPMSYPVYCGKDYNWYLFKTAEDGVICYSMSDSGDMEEAGYVQYKDIVTKLPDSDGMEVLKDYILTLNSRESFLGRVYKSIDESGYTDTIENGYYVSIGVTVLTALWRAALLDALFATGFGADGMIETIISMDMDMLDAPAIGGFV